MSVAVKWDVRGTVNGEDVALTSPSTAPTLALTELERHVVSIATATSLVLWSPTTAAFPSEPTAFDLFYAIATVAMFLELTCNEGNANERVFAVPLAAGFPFILAADDAFFNFTAGPAGDAYAGTLSVLNKIRVRNQSGATGILTYAVGKI